MYARGTASDYLKGPEKTIHLAWCASEDAWTFRHEARTAQLIYMRLSEEYAREETMEYFLPGLVNHPVVNAARQEAADWYALADTALRAQLATMDELGDKAIKYLDKKANKTKRSVRKVKEQVWPEAVNPAIRQMNYLVLRAAADLYPGQASTPELDALRDYHSKMVREALKGRILPLPEQRRIEVPAPVRPKRKYTRRQPAASVAA